jgi:glutathione S-transferase
MKLYYSHNLNPRVAVAVSRQLGSPVEFVRARPFHPAQVADFRKLNPNTRVPVLEEGGRTLWETDAIACRLSEFAGSDFWRKAAGQAQMIQWISWATHHLNTAAAVLYFEYVVIPQFPSAHQPPSAGPGKLGEALQEFRQFAAILDAQLKGRRWLLDDDELSYADFRVASALPFAGKAGLPIEDFAEVARWHGQLLQLKAWREPFDGIP